MVDRISQRIAGGIADVRLNRAAKMNGLDPAMFLAIAEFRRAAWDAKQTPDDGSIGKIRKAA
jgi:enoyl-CoA hydratase/carnithine racemase